MKRIFCFLATLYLGMAYAQPGQVIIIRHGEKNTVTFELTGAGMERADALSSYLTHPNEGPGFVGSAGLTNVLLFDDGLPFALFAARPKQYSDEFTARCINTLLPTALKLNLPINAHYGSGQEKQLARYILNDPRFDGKNVVICWHHTGIATLIEAFGYAPNSNIVPTYPNDRFDLVWPMTFPAPKRPAVVNPILQKLLFGDFASFP